jgi:hypothetical protein
MNMPKELSRAERNIKWIENYCLAPHGPEKGQHVVRTHAQRDAIRRIYDTPSLPPPDINGPLAAYLALLHICGLEAVHNRDAARQFIADIFTLWNSVGPDLRAVLKREGDVVICPELGTKYPPAAA